MSVVSAAASDTGAKNTKEVRKIKKKKGEIIIKKIINLKKKKKKKIPVSLAVLPEIWLFLVTSCTYDCKMVNRVYYILPHYIVYIYVYIYIYIIYMKTVNVKTSVLISILLHTEDCV